MFIFAHIGFTLLLFLVIKKYFQVSWIDTRLVIVGSMLPDILDKSIGYITPVAGRSLFHGFIPLFLLLSVLLLKSYGIFLSLFLSSSFHLVLDKMFLYPKILFWPVLGFELNMGVVDVNNYWYILFNSTYVQVTEIMGVIILTMFVVNYGFYRKENLLKFLKENNLKSGLFIG